MRKILLINSAPFTEDFVKPIADFFIVKNIPYQLVNYNDLPKSINNFTHIIISASPKGDDIIQEQLPIYNWIKECNIPILGSCHGHQLLGVLFGSEVIIAEEAEEGINTIQVNSDDPIFTNLDNVLEVEQHHVKSVTIPDNFKLLASSNKCKNQIMKHSTKPFYGCQFHIETRLDLVENFIKLSVNR